MQRDYSTQLLISYILWWFLGIFGAHRFFNGHWKSGVLMALTAGMCGIWWIIDAVLMSEIVREHLNEWDNTKKWR